MGGALGNTFLRSELLPLASTPADPAWIAHAVGDFDNDGYADIAWRNVNPSSGGYTAIWLMNGLNIRETTVLFAMPDLNWKMLSTGNYNRVGQTDILWRYESGNGIHAWRTVVWRMMKMTWLTGVDFNEELNGAEWQIGGFGGYFIERPLGVTAIDHNTRTITVSWVHTPESANVPNEEVLPDLQRKGPLDSTFQNIAGGSDYWPQYYTDNQTSPGRYEYRVGSTHIVTAIAEASDTYEKRGRVILVVESGLANSISEDIAAYKTNLVEDGWQVVQLNVNKTESVTTIRSGVNNQYLRDTTLAKHVILLGEVPVPISGYLDPDGHGLRAVSCDGYYGEMNGLWDDTQDLGDGTLEFLGIGANRAGDGKFSQNFYPGPTQGSRGDLEMGVGRIDFSKLSHASPDIGIPETAENLTKLYFAKNKRYRRGELSLDQRVLVTSTRGSKEIFDDALRLGSRIYGIDSTRVLHQDSLRGQAPAVWGFHAGQAAGYSSVSTSSGLNFFSGHFYNPATEPRLFFINLDCSYVFDIVHSNNLLRAFLASPNYGMLSSWRGALAERSRLAQLALGETVGREHARSINAMPSGDNIHMPILGDPTLRLQVIAPIQNLVAQNGVSGVTLTWTAPIGGDPSMDYVVERSSQGLWDGTWQRLSTTSQLSYADNNAGTFGSGTTLHYRVRSRKLITTGSGSYYCLGHGILRGVVR